ncbi:hypothetical protein BKA65DRAFT_146222 [Rhexocercosporidium sp. MPI-PUGE-AT-0058]|nr:hypothetical protein BKA65DRAFT_146222 [Rhexocercosporidium sp. MPI-PUGE-AT-0058]
MHIPHIPDLVRSMLMGSRNPSCRSWLTYSDSCGRCILQNSISKDGLLCLFSDTSITKGTSWDIGLNDGALPPRLSAVCRDSLRCRRLRRPSATGCRGGLLGLPLRLSSRLSSRKFRVFTIDLGSSRRCSAAAARTSLSASLGVWGAGVLCLSGEGSLCGRGGLCLSGEGSLCGRGVGLLCLSGEGPLCGRGVGLLCLSGEGSLCGRGVLCLSGEGPLCGRGVGLLCLSGEGSLCGRGVLCLSGEGSLCGRGVGLLCLSGEGSLCGPGVGLLCLSGDGSLCGCGTSSPSSS